MQYVVRASFKDGKPQLSVIDLDTRRVCFRWKLEKIQEMFESEEIKQEEFSQPQKYGMNLLLKNLFLISCTRDLNHHRQDNQCNTNKKPVPDGIWPFNVLMGPMK